MHAFRAFGSSVLLLSGAAFLSVGCSHEVATAPVTGQVVVAGQPLVGGGEIRFVADQGAGLPPAFGAIDAQGNFALSTYAPGDGVAPGRYRVEIVQNAFLEPEKRATVVSEDGKSSEGAVISAAKPIPANRRIDGKFATPQSPVVVTVEPGQQAVVVDLGAEDEAVASSGLAASSH